MNLLTAGQVAILEGFLMADVVAVVEEFEVLVDGVPIETVDTLAAAELKQWEYIRSISELDDSIYINPSKYVD